MWPKNKTNQPKTFLKKKKKKKNVRGHELRQGIELKVNASPSLDRQQLFHDEENVFKKRFHEIGNLSPGLLCTPFSCSSLFLFIKFPAEDATGLDCLSEKWIKKYLSILQPKERRWAGPCGHPCIAPHLWAHWDPASKIRHEALQQPRGPHAYFSSPTLQGHRWVPHLPLVHPSLPLQAVPLPGEQSPPPWSVCT